MQCSASGSFGRHRPGSTGPALAGTGAHLPLRLDPRGAEVAQPVDLRGTAAAAATFSLVRMPVMGARAVAAVATAAMMQLRDSPAAAAPPSGQPRVAAGKLAVRACFSYTSPGIRIS